MESLFEVTYPDIQIIQEATKENGNRMRVRTLMQVAEEWNGNNRYYPEATMDREVLKLQEQVKRRTAFGEADHPVTGKSTIQNTASMLESIEKKVTEKGRKEYWGEVTILNTIPGVAVAEILKAGGRLGISSRSFGSTKTQTIDNVKGEVVQPDLSIKGFDFVIGQSVKGADVALGEQVDVVNIFEAQDWIDEGEKKPENTNPKGGTDNMLTLEQLKKDYPNLVEALTKELEGKSEKEIRESIQKELDAKFDARLAEEIEKKRTEIKDEIVAEIKDSEEFKSHGEFIAEIVELFKKHGLIEAGSGGEDEDNQAEIVKLKEELKSEKGERTKLSETLVSMTVKGYISEVVAGKPHAALLTERLSGCKTNEEVDKALEKEQDYIKQITEAAGTPAGTGKVEDDEDKPPVKEGTKEADEKAMQERQRRIAGLPPLDEKKDEKK